MPEHHDVEYLLGALRTVAAVTKKNKMYELYGIAQASIDLYEKGPERCAAERGDAPPAPTIEPTPVRWMRAEGVVVSEGEMRRASVLFQKGDAILAWVNEGDILSHRQESRE